MVTLTKELTEFKRPSEHSTFSPSAADQWITCPASIRLSAGIEEKTSKWAAEGTTAHSLCEDLFAHYHYGMPRSHNLMFADEEMMDAAQVYYDVVNAWLAFEEEIGDVLWFGLEKGIPVFPEESCFGTADCVIVGTKGAVIIDFKYGKNKAVSGRCTQLRVYALGLYRYLLNAPADYKYHAVVVQPRVSPAPKHAEYTASEMGEFEKVVWDAIQKSKNPNLEPVEGNCYWCKAKRTNEPGRKCPIWEAKAMKVTEEDFAGFMQDMNTPVEKLGAPNSKRDKALIKMISLLPLVEQVAKDAQEEFMIRLERGETIEGLRIIEKKGRKKWALDGQDMINKLRTKYPNIIPTKTTLKVKSMGDIKREVGKDFDESLTVVPISKQVFIENFKMNEVLEDLAAYNQMFQNDSNQELL